MLKIKITSTVFVCSSLIAVAAFVWPFQVAYSQDDDVIEVSNSPVDLQADSLVHNKDGQSVTAAGDVVLKQDGKTVNADEIVYFLQDDKVVATGNVVFTDVTGDKHYADYFEFNDALKNGFVEGLKTVLVDGSRFMASNGRQVEGKRVVMKDAHYTPCEVCETDRNGEPLWQIRASEVEHDKESKTVSYRNARFEMEGVPVAYLPYFSHPDGSVKRKSGFLTPSAGYKSDVGGFIENKYYWDIAPEKDLTVGMRVMSRETPLATAQWRQRWTDASLIAEGSFTYSERTDNEAGVEFKRDREWRGNLRAEGLWDINNKWRSGIKIDVASDDQYLRQYDFDEDTDDVLDNEIYLERFSGRNYAVGRFLAFQDVRLDEEGDTNEDQPNVLPEIEASFIGEPDSIPLIGGRWDADVSVLGLVRDNNGQDVNRLHTGLGWKKRLVSDFGLVTELDANAQASYYDIHDRLGAQNDASVKPNTSEFRGFASFNAETSYPLAKSFGTTQMVVEPVTSVTLAPDIDADDVPNEDSQDVQIDALSLFNNSRFPGVDSIEDQSRVTYGLRSGLYTADGSYGDVFIGQSYNFDNDENPFDRGSGLDDQNSDVVGEVRGNYKGDYALDYRFQLDNDSLSSQRHEVDASAKLFNVNLSSRYLFAKAIENGEDNETREQILNSATYYINDKWRLYGAARHDLGDEPGLREANLGINYLGQCISWSVVGTRTLTDDASGDSGTEIFLRIGFKNLGEFNASGVQFGGSGE